MNTHKKQKHKQGIPQGHSGCDLKNKKILNFLLRKKNSDGWTEDSYPTLKG